MAESVQPVNFAAERALNSVQSLRLRSQLHMASGN